MADFINCNGKLVASGDPVIQPGDHSYRYGDGLFETIKLVKGEIILRDYHFSRLITGAGLLKMNLPPRFTAQNLTFEIAELCKANNCNDAARIRLSVSRGEGGLYDCDNHLNYIIECSALNEPVPEPDDKGIIIGIYPDAKKSCDKFSNLKSANYLPYIMAALWARENEMEDALLLNQYDHICDATIANVFWIKNGYLFTSPLSEGCVAGIMRQWILNCGEQVADLGLQLNESVLSPYDLLEADEIFLTNVISGIRYVSQFENKIYDHLKTQEIFKKIILPLYHQ